MGVLPPNLANRFLFTRLALVMTKAELIDRIARSRDLPPDMTKKCVAQIVDLAFGELSSYFSRAKVTRNKNVRFSYPGFGVLSKKKRSARKGVNPRTLEPMEIEASFTIDFKPAAELRDLMNRQNCKPCPRTDVSTMSPAVHPDLPLDSECPKPKHRAPREKSAQKQTLPEPWVRRSAGGGIEDQEETEG